MTRSQDHQNHNTILFIGICTAFLIPIFGTFFRIVIGSGGLLVLDIFLPLFTLIWIYFRWREGAFMKHWRSIMKLPFFWPLVLFPGIALLSLLFNSIFFSLYEFFESAFYCIRFFFLSIFSVLVFDILQHFPQKERRKKLQKLIHVFFISLLTLAGIGYLQLWIFPDFKVLNMEDFGWDPHIGRLVSTWFDPNFLGGLFAFSSAIGAGLLVTSQQKKEKALLCIILIPLVIACVLTFSRSAFLALFVSLGLFGLLFSRRILTLCILFFCFLFPISDRFQERVTDGIYSMKSFIEQEESYFLPDETARLRIESWRSAYELFLEKPFIGHGFNTLRTVQSERGIIPKNLHSGGGFDSSLLTILVTTGIFGLLAFFWIFLSFLLQSIQIWRLKNTPVMTGVSKGFFCGLFGIFIHSFFVNSLLFPWIMVYIFGFAGVLFLEWKK